MTKIFKLLNILVLLLLIQFKMPNVLAQEGAFASDEVFLKKHSDAVTLTNGDAAVIVAPIFQGRVMTSTYDKKSGPSFGWINRPVIEKGFLTAEERKGKLEEHIYIFGGEERFWLGPEGGQYALYFKPGDEFTFENWFTPSVIDTEAFKMVRSTESSATFSHNAKLVNYSGTVLEMGIKRKVTLLNKDDVETELKISLGKGIRMVAYETDNSISNIGNEPWTADGGLPSIWLLGMYNPSPKTTIVIPFKKGSEVALGSKVNDTYFGKVPAEYLQVEEDVLFLKGDGTYRSKIGINSKRSLGIAGSFDADGNVLTIVTYNVQDAPNGFVNSMWELQQKPFSGDVINAYNDGAPAPGVAPMGPFYEIETSSPAAALAPGGVMQHIQKTIHLHGTEEELNIIAKKAFGVSLAEIKSGSQ